MQLPNPIDVSLRPASLNHIKIFLPIALLHLQQQILAPDGQHRELFLRRLDHLFVGAQVALVVQPSQRPSVYFAHLCQKLLPSVLAHVRQDLSESLKAVTVGLHVPRARVGLVRLENV